MLPACTPAAQTRRARPDDLTRAQHRFRRRERLERHPGADLDAMALKRPVRIALGVWAECTQQHGALFHQDDAGPVHIEIVEVPFEHLVDELRQGPRDLDTGGPAADDEEVQDTVVEQLRDGISRLEEAQRVVAHAHRVLERVEGECELVGSRDPEEVRGRPAGDDEVVERDRVLVLEQHLVTVPIDTRDQALAEQHPALTPEQPTNGIGDISGVEPARRDLVEQRLELVVVVLIDHGDIDRSVLQPLRGVEPTEACPDDDDVHTSGHVVNLGAPAPGPGSVFSRRSRTSPVLVAVSGPPWPETATRTRMVGRPRGRGQARRVRPR